MTASHSIGTARRITVSLSWLLADRGMRLAGGFLVGLWLARYLGPSDFGLLSVATAATFFGVVATQMGVDGLVQRELVRRPDDAGVILGTVTILGMVVALVTWVLIAAVAVTVVHDPAMRSVLLWLGLLVVPQALVGWEYLFQARSDLRPVVIGQNACFAFCLILRTILILLHAHVVSFAIVAVIERLGGALAVVAWGSRRHPVGRLGFDGKIARNVMREAWPVWASALLTTAYLKMDQILIAHWAGVSATGTYAAATRLSELWWSVSTIVATAVLPDLVRARHKSEQQYWSILQKYLDASAAISILAAVIMTVIAPLLVRLFYGVRYADAAGIVAIQFWSAVFIFLSVARGRHLITSGRRLVELWFSLGGVALNLSANVILVPRYGAIGAAWAGLLTQVGVSLGLPWLFATTRGIARMQLAALLFPLRGPGIWREVQFRIWPAPTRSLAARLAATEVSAPAQENL
jgi:PST family polysaccharide transporter